MSVENKIPRRTFALDMRTIAIAISTIVTLLLGGISAAYFIGYSIRDMEARQKQIEDLHILIEQEVGGLRADWERDRKGQEKRLDKLEK